MTMPAETASRVAGIRTTHVLLALAAIALLAFALPFSAVRTLHARRLDAADRQLLAIADALRDDRRPRNPNVVLVGPGQVPRSVDVLWTGSMASPLTRQVASVSADPWGNAYLVASAWVVSAGPDGIIQTPFPREPGVFALAADDRAVRIP